jgi:ubiquinone/menaquinone biosynthesis C-methylase UbiE
MKPDRSTEYILGYSAEEHARLDEQAARTAEATRDALITVGIQKGWNCLDVACGTGSVMRIMGELVGPNGKVHGIDLDSTYGEIAVKQLAAEAISQFSFEKLDALSGGTPNGAPFDLVFARHFLVHMADRTDALRRLWSWVRPGGTLLVIDFDIHVAAIFANDIIEDSVGALIRRIFTALGKDVRAGMTNHQHFLLAGLGKWDGTKVATFLIPSNQAAVARTATLNSLRTLALKNGIATEVEFEHAISKVREIGRNANAMARMPDIVATWKRKSG